MVCRVATRWLYPRFGYSRKEIECPTHGRVQEAIPWAPAYSRITYRPGVAPLRPVPSHDPAGRRRDPENAPSTLADLLHRIVRRVREGHKIRGLVTLGVDEISFSKGRKFATLLYDLDRARLLWVGRGKGRQSIDRFFNQCLSKGQRARIRWASCDMSGAYTEAIKHHCPKATLVIDRFDVVKAPNQAVDKVRKEEWRRLDAEGRKAIKGLRWHAPQALEKSRQGQHPFPQQPA